MAGRTRLEEEIRTLRKEQDAVILAHNYQVPEVQDIADLVGDSLELARAAVALDCAVIVFCGVDFMAETAAILSPEKKVILPAWDACCPMAEMVTTDELAVVKERYPDAAVVSYVNTTAEVKAASDICCTSANAVKIVGSLPEHQVIFIPDRNLAHYVGRFTGKEILPWDGFCIVHDRFTVGDVIHQREKHPDAEVLVHPECRPDVIDAADHVFSTSGIIRHVCESTKEEFVIGTETGILHQIEKRCPSKRCIPLSPLALCVNMKKTSLAKVRDALITLRPQVRVPPDIAIPARRAIERMLNLS